MISKSTLSKWLRDFPLSKENFKKSYIKKSNLTDITYKNGFGHGTCSLMVHSTNLHTFIISAIKCLKNSALLRKTS